MTAENGRRDRGTTPDYPTVQTSHTSARPSFAPSIDTCDCGGGYPCEHGRFLYGFDVEGVEPTVTEVCELPESLASLFIVAPELAASLKRCVESLDDLIRYCNDPGTEALGAVYEARGVLSALTLSPVTLADGRTWHKEHRG